MKETIIKKSMSIKFLNLIMDGKDQDKWFKIFDLIDEIFPDHSELDIVIDSCTIENFMFLFKDLPKGTTKREFADFIMKTTKENQLITLNRKKTPCPGCEGSGFLEEDNDGGQSGQRVCPVCNGQGEKS